MNETFSLRILTPTKTLFEGAILAVSSTNSTGKFDILARHANFITLIENQEIKIILADHKPLSVKFSEAIIFNANGKVSIYAEPQLG